MKIQKKIDELKELLAFYEEHKGQAIKLNTETENSNNNFTWMGNCLRYLIKLQEKEVDSKILVLGGQIKELERYFQTDYLVQFEELSAEVNEKMTSLIQEAEKKLPRITNHIIKSKISFLLEKYKPQQETIEQEDKNEIYVSLKRHLSILK